MVEPENKGTLLATSSYLTFVNKFYRSGLSSLTLLDEVSSFAYEGLNFKTFDPVFEKFNDQIHHFIASGVTEKLLQENANPLRRVLQKEEAVEAQVLTLEHLSAGFFVCGIVLTLGFAVFLMEVSVPLLKRTKELCFKDSTK